MAAYRAPYARRPAPPPPLGRGDELARTAQQVRIAPLGTAHRLKAAETHVEGRRYWTACGGLLKAADGAVLTTLSVDCSTCRWAASAPGEEARHA